MNIVDGTFTDTQLQEALNRAEIIINRRTDTVFVDGTGATPTYTQVTNEKHRGKGTFNRDYYTGKFPLPNVSTNLNGAVAVDDTTITVDSTDGFPSSGIIGIGNDKVSYAGKTDTTFTTCTNVNNIHLDAVAVKPYVIEISGSESGSEPTWSILTEGKEFDIDIESGRFYIYQNSLVLDAYAYNNPPKIPNRARLTYIHGTSTIPLDIEKVCLMVASNDLMKSAVRSATINGMNDFNPAMINVDEEEIERIFKRYNSMERSNV